MPPWKEFGVHPWPLRLWLAQLKAEQLLQCSAQLLSAFPCSVPSHELISARRLQLEPAALCCFCALCPVVVTVLWWRFCGCASSSQFLPCSPPLVAFPILLFFAAAPSPVCIPQIYLAFRLRGEIDQPGLMHLEELINDTAAHSPPLLWNNFSAQIKHPICHKLGKAKRAPLLY